MKFTIGCLFFLVISSQNVVAQQLVYKPINSAFGGDSYNYNWMLNSANAQNPYKSNSGYDGYNNSPISSFSENLNRQILNQISQGLFGTDYEDGSMKPGVYNLGTMNINISDYYGGLNISIIDIKTGEQTNILLPNN